MAKKRKSKAQGFSASEYKRRVAERAANKQSEGAGIPTNPNSPGSEKVVDALSEKVRNSPEFQKCLDVQQTIRSVFVQPPIKSRDTKAAAAVNSRSWPNKKSWIHRIPIWKEFGPWLKWASASFAFAATMTQLGEYGWALAGLLTCGVCCILQIYVWTTSSSKKFKNQITKSVLVILSIAVMAVGALTVLRIKGDKPWTHLWGQSPVVAPLASTVKANEDLRSELRADGNRAIRLITVRITLKRRYSINEIGHFRVMYEVGSETNKITPEFYLGSQDYYDVNSTINSTEKQFGYRWTVRYRKPNDTYAPTEGFSNGRGYGATTGLTPTTDTLEFSADIYNQIPSDRTMEDLFGKYLYIFITESLADKIEEISFQVNNWQLFSVKANRLVCVDDKPIAPWFMALSKEEQDVRWKSVMARFEEQLPPTVKGQYEGWTWSLDPGSLHPKKIPEPELKVDPFKSN